jgi:zinc transport system ATP-binding protein
MAGPSIEFSQVGLTLGNTRILEDVSFSVRAGTIHCIVGANGGGKTSLVRSLVGQMPHTGRISIRWNEGRVIGYVPQVLDFDRSLPVTVMDFMALTCQRRPAFLGVSRARRRDIETVLGGLGMLDKLRTRIGSLSGGERQRLLFAQALLPAPSLLVLDEPTAGLDAAGEDILEQAIRDFAGSGGTVVWINHDIAQVGEVADALTYINRKVLLDGPPREVLAQPGAARLFSGLPSAAARGAGT